MKLILKTISEEGLIRALKNSGVFRFFLCNLLYSINLWLTMAYYPVYFNKIGISDGRIGVLISMFSFITLLFVVPFGVMSDRLKPKTLLRIGAILMVISNIAITFKGDFYYLMGFIILVGIGSTLFIITLSSLFYKQLDETRKGVRVALFALGTALGFGTGPFIGGFIINYSDINNVFFLAGILNAALFLLVFALKSSRPFKFRFEMYKNDILKPKVFFAIIIVFVMSSHFGVEETCMTLFMTKNIGLTGLQIGSIFMCIGAWIAVINLVAGHSFDKTKKLTLFISLSLLISGGFQILTAYADSFGSLLSIRLAHALGDGFYLVLRALLIAHVFPSKRMGGNFGFMYAVYTGSITISSLISGRLNGMYGYDFPFIVSGILVMSVAIIMLTMRTRIENMLLKNETP